MKDRIIIIASVAIAIFLFVFAFLGIQNKNKKQREHDQIELKTSEFRTEKKILEAKLKALNEEYKEIKQGVGSLLLVFLDTEEYVFEDIVPFLEEKNIPATLCFSLENITNKDIDFSKSKVQSLIDKSWQTALYWDGTANFDEWHKEISDKLTALEIDIPHILCIEREKADKLSTLELSSFGINGVLVKNYSIYDLVYDDIGRNTINGVGWFSDNVPDSLSTLCDGGQLAYFLGTDHKFFYYRDGQFENMLNNIVKLMDSGEIKCTTFAGAIELSKENNDRLNSLGDTLLQEISLTEKKINNIIKTIDDLNKGNNK